MTKQLMIDPTRFNNTEFIRSRVALASAEDQGSLRSALKYLYLDDGPVNMPLERRKAAEPYLEAAERLLVGWLAIRTNGALAGEYGKDALRAARAARYRCQECGFPDVRVLNLDHVDGRVQGTAFACLRQLSHDQVASDGLDRGKAGSSPTHRSSVGRC